MNSRPSPPVLPPVTAPVTAEALTKRFGDVTAVNRLDFTIDAGSVTAILGSNGAGKTTTISMMLGLILPTSGQVRVFGADMARERHKVLHRLNFESPYIDMPMRLTVRQNLAVFGRLYGVQALATRIDELTTALRLTDLLDRPAGRLSAGQRTRVSLAKALINAPELLLLDEPTASLDPDTADWMRQWLLDFRKARGATIVLASHNMLEVERMADRVILLDRGRIVEDGAPQAIITRHDCASLEEVFLTIVRRQQG